MLGLFSGANAANAAAATAQPRPSGAANASGGAHKRRNNHVGGGKAATAAATMAASDVLMTADGSAPTRSIHAFTAPEAETVLGLRRLLVKVVGAKDLPESVGARRSCSAEVQLVTELGSALPNGVLNDKTGPPNHFTTVKDTAPVWNAEFVTELPSDMQTHGVALRFAVYDDAASPPARLGEAYIHGSELERLCMREEERTLVLEQMNAEAYAATLAGLSYEMTANERGFFVEVHGFSDTLGRLATRLLLGLPRRAQRRPQFIIVRRPRQSNLYRGDRLRRLIKAQQRRAEPIVALSKRRVEPYRLSCIGRRRLGRTLRLRRMT